jgi:hypothetical protein
MITRDQAVTILGRPYPSTAGDPATLCATFNLRFAFNRNAAYYGVRRVSYQYRKVAVSVQIGRDGHQHVQEDGGVKDRSILRPNFQPKRQQCA